MADVGPPRKRIAQLLRMLRSSGGKRRNAFAALEGVMRGRDITWSDIGNWVEGGEFADGAYTEDELQQFAQARYAEGVEAGIKIGEARKSNGGGNGHIALPKPADMAEYCHEQLGRLKDDKQREFVTEVYLITQRGRNLSPGRLGYLASIYIGIGGRT